MLRGLTLFFEAETGKRLKNMIIGVGASVVMMGALFKLQHWEGAGAMLVVGLSTEALIFALLGILPPVKDYYWEKIYSNLDVSPEEEEAKGIRGSAIEQLEEELRSGEIGTEVIDSLGSNLRKLGDNMSRLSDLTDAAIATNDYADNAKLASQALSDMRVAYTTATEAVSNLASVSESADDYRDQMASMAKNVGALNELYELELSETNSNRQAINKFYGNMQNILTNLEESVDDTRKYKNEVATLAENIAHLNSVYGNMLTAMTSGSGRE